MALGMAACSSAEPAGDVAQGPADGGNVVRMEMTDSKFLPADLDLEAGGEVTVEVTNNDDMVHDFAIESLDLNTGPIEAGEGATATFTAPEGGAEFVCTYHSDMTGRIEIN
jgi:plastocyanin